jgi:serine/threonine protein kinase
LSHGGVPVELVAEEFNLRRHRGDGVAPSDFFRRFPEHAAELARLLNVTVPASTTAVAAQPSPAVPELEAGRSIDDFDLLACVGRGAFACVFLARQRSMQRLVALKVSAGRGAEAQALARLDHPNIVRVHDLRILADQGLRLLSMNYLPGGTLLDVIEAHQNVPRKEWSGRSFLAAVDAVLTRRGESPPAASELRSRLAAMTWPDLVAWVGARLAHALDYAHRQGVLHRDVKPANVLLTAEGSPCLADFNVGCLTRQIGDGPTALFGGSLAYMAPEQMTVLETSPDSTIEEIDGRADLYALAVTLWELLAGRRPFPEPERGEWSETLSAIKAFRRAGVPAESSATLSVGGLTEALTRCLDPDRDRRPATGAEWACSLDLCREPAVATRPSGWRAWVRHHPLLAIFPLGVAVNALASLFNIVYNQSAIIDRLSPATQGVFQIIIVLINGTFFPLCLALWLAAAWPVARAVRNPNPTPPAEAFALRRRCLNLGAWSAAVCLGGWVTAGVLWPLSLDVSAELLTLRDHVHLLVSLTLCGLIAAAYPFFIVSFMSVSVLYPALLRTGSSPNDAAELTRLERILGLYLMIAAAVPLLGVTLMTLDDHAQRLPLQILSVAGFFGFGLIYTLDRAIRADLAALRRVVEPGSGRV